MAANTSLLQFAPFTSTIESGFWHTFTKLKLEKLKLSEEDIPITGYYSNGDRVGLPTRLSVEHDAFERTHGEVPNNYYVAHGNLFNMNTIESFKDKDKKQLMLQFGQKIWDDISNGKALEDPSLLVRFLVLSFADLKKYNYVYWFAFPALSPEVPVTMETVTSLQQAWKPEPISELLKTFDAFKAENRKGTGFFLVKNNSGKISLESLAKFDTFYSNEDQVVLGICDPCTLDFNPGWPLRNFLILAAKLWSSKVSKVDILCLRDCFHEGRRTISHSLYLKGVDLPNLPDGNTMPRVLGWERNEHGKLAPRTVNLSRTMDPVKLTSSAVDLNLKLMRWRLMPNLDLEIMKGTKCLLLGAGTLGCNVARALLGWGYRHITLVDNGRVSYSNPVRQTLYMFEDSQDGGKKKAETAAEMLRRIFPGVNAKGVSFTIPMPGHAIGSESAAKEETLKAVNTLDELIKESDVVFLLLDSREARWLPTVMSLAHGKICINAALGFDTYMVMRHGYRSLKDSPPSAPPTLPKTCIAGNILGCYFCSDVVGPTNSLKDRTLDQQCTVSRPGTSMMASSLAVELLTGLLQHPLKGLAPACLLPPDEAEAIEIVPSTLGPIPHQIRGSLYHFTSVLPASMAFGQCPGCAEIVIKHFREEGFDFLLKVFNDSEYLEDLTGLSQLHKIAAEVDILELSDNEDA